mgnify:CR=1 FL=1
MVNHKEQTSNPKQMANYNLENRTLEFAKTTRAFVKVLPRCTSNFEDGKQLIRSSGSIGANYIEANEALSKKDFKMRVKISRKEAKESAYWLKLVDVQNNSELEKQRLVLIKDSF